MAKNKDLTSTSYLQLNNKTDPSLILTEERKASLNLHYLGKLLAINRLGQVSRCKADKDSIEGT